MRQQQRITFDVTNLAPVRLPFEYDGVKYVLHEAGLGDVLDWRAFRDVAEADEKGKDRRLMESGPYLVSLCLHEEGGEPVGLERIKTFGHRLTEALILKVLEISDLLAAPTQEAMEKELAALLQRLVSLASNGAERTQWRDWIVAETDKALMAPIRPPEDAAKNGVTATPVPTA